MLQSIATPISADHRASLRSDGASKALDRILSTAAYYEEKLSSGTRSAKDAFRIVSKDIEQNGLQSTHDVDDDIRYAALHDLFSRSVNPRQLRQETRGGCGRIYPHCVCRWAGIDAVSDSK